MTNFEHIPQSGLRTKLTQRNAILLICSCVAQMMIVCINPGKFDLYKGLMGGVSFLCGLLLIIHIWRNTEPTARVPLYLRLFVFVCAFQAFLLLTNALLGGVIAMILSGLFLGLLLKIVPQPD